MAEERKILVHPEGDGRSMCRGSAVKSEMSGKEGFMHFKRAIVAAGLLFATVGIAGAQQTVTKASEPVNRTATISQINSTDRLITFKNEAGTEYVVKAGPDIVRFGELKVGDKVNFLYYESTVYQLRKPGDKPLNPPSNSTATTGTAGTLPGGTKATQTMRTVRVTAVDANAGTITVQDGGTTITRMVDNKANLNGVKVGDQIDIIYTEAMLVSVERQP
jgi:Cu/Ag efflux protein CusF